MNNSDRTESASLPKETAPILLELLEKMPEKCVLVVGDLMLDRFIRGDVNRISPESPIPILQAKQENRMIGGAGNVLSNLHALKCGCEIIAIIGDDREGQIVKGLVEASGANGDGLVVRPETPTTIKTRYLSGHQQLLRVDHEVTAPISAALEDRIILKLQQKIAAAQALVLSDYGKGVLTRKVIETAISLAHKHSIPVLVDPKGSDYSKYRGATLVTPNRKELAEATNGAATDTDSEVIIAAEKLIQQSGISAVIATRSQDGMSIIAQKADGTGFERPYHLRTHAREVFDVSGAGDTVIATIAAGLACGSTLLDATSLANIAGGIVVGKVGTAPIRAQELKDALTATGHELEITPSGDFSALDRARCAPVLSWEEALEEVNRWRARGLKVGFTNGCFDILHAGHVNYLNDARNQCDRLVLGLNTDQSVRLLKGPTRPVNSQDSRATVLGALGAIDLVVFFGAETLEDDSTAKKLIQHLKPDIYFKGADYTLDRIPEVPIVLSYGGEVKLVKLTEGHSTTNIISKINANSEAAE
ncbi:MAG: D-glycero-beta-D-manno-heptose-7-phosphate kinase [Pseudobdellovibrionaceae bacterium]|nr:D-glycero-beta-D-manno-heptose-7-phosphate kinase [Pseudobdellovibrionaceae bacterium]